MKKILLFIKEDIVLSISALCAFLTILIVPFDQAYLGYVDFRVLSLLFCFMVLVAGLKSCHIFSVIGQNLLKKSASLPFLAAVLVGLPFFSSMMITNDVALLTFVPFAIAVLDMAGQKKYTAIIVVWQTIAANLGSMTTPFGNPQNIYLFSKYGFSLWEFFKILFPYSLLSLVLLFLCTKTLPKDKIQVHFTDEEQIEEPKNLVLFFALFLLCILCVIRIVPYPLMLLVVVIAVYWKKKSLFRQVDYRLLITFVCFFLFSGNVSRMGSVQELFSHWVTRYPILCGTLLSQVISNVPAAVLLSSFTNSGTGLLIGCNVGGLGTPVASLASLISWKLFQKSEGTKDQSYMKKFTIWNILFLIVLLGFTLFFI